MSETPNEEREPEIFIPIKGYEGSYTIGSHGNVYSVKSDLIMRPSKDKDLYLQVSLSKAGVKKTTKIARLVAIHFIPNPENKPEVNHLKGKQNNYYKDLAWATGKENCQHAHATGLRNSDHCRHPVKSTNIKTGESQIFTSTRHAERELKIGSGFVSAVLVGKYKQAKGYTFVKI